MIEQARDDRAIDHLVVVAGHAPFRREIRRAPDDPSRDDPWVLQDFQRGEPRAYLEHIRAGVDAAQSPRTLLVFSGGRTRREAGPWSEGETYLSIARSQGWVGPGTQMPSERCAVEEYARDSFENLLYSLDLFCRARLAPPRTLTVVSWRFKKERFDLHRQTLRFPKTRYRFLGPNDPTSVEDARKGEFRTLEAFRESPYGLDGSLAEKKALRNPFSVTPPPPSSELASFFQFLAQPENTRQVFSEAFPWEAS